MAGRLRTAAALAAVAALTPVYATAHVVGRRLRLVAPTRMPRAWCRLVARLLSLRVVAVGAPETARPLLVVANHVSWIDIIVLGSLMEASFVARGDMGGWPVIGGLAKLADTIFVDRSHRRGSAGQASDIAGRLAQGEAVILFAEGTTGDGNWLRPFKSSLLGAVGLAGREAGVEPVVQPVAIAYTRHHGVAMGRRHRMRASWIGDEDLVPHVRDLLRRDVFDVEVHFADAFGLDGVDRKAATRRAENAIRQSLAAALRDPR